jgi:hypothetical protein
MNDLDLSGYSNWTPIGNATTANQFRGNFNGNGKVISNLTINRPTTNYQGLFGYLNGGTIKNLGVENCNITGQEYIGGLAGSGGSYENCYVTGAVNGTRIIGGLVGSAGSSITNCYTTCTVTGSDFVGGLVGNASASITNCYTTGNVNGSDNVGGLTGANTGNLIQKCYATGNISGNANVGGLVGHNTASSSINSRVRDCYATGNVTGSESYVGGLVGQNAYVGVIENSYASGNVIGNNYVGGLSGSGSAGGYVSPAIRNCIAANNSVIATATSGTTYVNRAIGGDIYTNALYNIYALESMVVQNYNGIVTSTNSLTGAAGMGKPLADLASFNFYNTAGNWNGSYLWSIATGEDAGKVWRICSNGAVLPLLQWQQDFNCNFIPVTNITGVPETAIANTPLILTGTVTPNNATNKNIVWSIFNAGGTGATISNGNTLNATGAGNATVRATIEIAVRGQKIEH